MVGAWLLVRSLGEQVSGNFHFAPGKSFQHAHVHVHDLAAFTAGTFNISHQIHNLQFGTSYPGAKQPLDNSSQTVTDGTSASHAFMPVHAYPCRMLCDCCVVDCRRGYVHVLCQSGTDIVCVPIW